MEIKTAEIKKCLQLSLVNGINIRLAYFRYLTQFTEPWLSLLMLAAFGAQHLLYITLKVMICGVQMSLMGGPKTNSLNVLSWHCKLPYGWLDNPSCSAMASLSEWMFKSSCLIHDMCYMRQVLLVCHKKKGHGFCCKLVVSFFLCFFYVKEQKKQISDTCFVTDKINWPIKQCRVDSI